ncbi:unnamed protein product [Phyllotreta striolata]|uniref:Uncharacterized protein n=1 Tax=Phyllotreta striolata TaxID=444603 RepID=A0A9N9XTX0_PHYSR|nr:unnamed protein product [Phyllotreta striolata]
MQATNFLAASVLLCIGVGAVAATAGFTKEDEIYLEGVFKDIPMEDRKYVLLHQLYLGYIDQNPQLTPKSYDINPSDTKKIFNLFVTKKKLDVNVTKLMQKICLPTGICIDTNDPGVYP